MNRRRVTAFFSASCCLPLVVAACGEESAGPTLATSSPPEATMPTTDRPSTPEPSNSTTPSSGGPSITPIAPATSGPSSNLEIANADVRARLGTDADVEVVSHEEVTWPDGGLGCPEPGMSYTQALVNGERIVLRADGVDYEYHAGKNRPAFYCPPNRITPPSAGSYGDV